MSKVTKERNFALNFPEYPLDGQNLSIVGHGGNHYVYRIEDSEHVVRIPMHSPSLGSLGLMNIGYIVQKHLFDNEVSVPEPDGLFRLPEDISILDEHGVEVPRVPFSDFYFGSVMEYVPGTSLLDLRFYGLEKVIKKAQEKFETELEKARKLRVSPFDEGGNAIWTPDERVVLIDFELWGMRK